MMKSILLLAVTLSVPALWAAEGDAPKIPPSAQAILDAAERAIAANRAKYDYANIKPLADAEKALKAEQDKLAKAGKLEEALAIKKILDAFQDELVAKVDERAVEKTDLLGARKTDWAKALAGRTFIFTNGRSIIANLTLEKNGKISGTRHPNESSWSYDEKNAALVFMRNDGVVSTTFTEMKEENGKLVITGKYMFSQGVTHILKEP